MSERLTDIGGACCAHKRVVHTTEPAGEGAVRDVWECELCGHRFVPAARLEAVLAERDERNAWLAECYRLSGADTDGDEDWRLAPSAVDAVRELRKDYDEDCQDVSAEKERDAERARAEAAEARVAIAEDLLKRVVIHGGSGSWTWREMYDWCCDYKGWSNGYGREVYDRPHDNCSHRKRPGTECGAIGAGDSDEPVPPLFGPDGLLRRVELAEARVTELEADRKRLALTVAHLRHAIPASEWGDMQCGVCGCEAFLSSDGRYGDGDPALCGCGGCITVDEEDRQVWHSDVQEEHSEDFAEVQEWAEKEVQEDPYKVSLAEPGGWRPIETAPRDKSKFFGFDPEIGEPEVMQLYVELDDGRVGWESDGHGRKPTLWMPLPPPPAGEESEEVEA